MNTTEELLRATIKALARRGDKTGVHLARAALLYIKLKNSSKARWRAINQLANK